MSGKERVRLEALGRVKRGEMTVTAAAQLMNLSLRQARRVWKRFQFQGDAGLAHQLRGRASNHRLSQDARDRAVKLHQEIYSDFGPTLACEKLVADHDLTLSPDTLTALLKERGLWQRRRRRGRHRSRRERRASFGSLIQMDGSHHDWFEGRAAKCVLMVMIDDATNQTFARFYPGETTQAAFDVFARWTRGNGLPRSLYVDRHSIYRDEDHPDHPTQFGRAMKELSVELICANSPQAKGRVERRNAVFQDRLVKEMRLRKISDIAQANALLDKMFLADLNKRYALKARREQDLHRGVEAGVKLEEILCVAEERVVGLDWCVRWRNRWLQIDKSHQALNLAKRRVRVRELADGRLLLDCKETVLQFRDVPSKPSASRQKKPVINSRQWKPGKDDPWNSTPAVGVRSQTKPPAAAPRKALSGDRRKAG
jgi:transposase